MSSKQIKEQFSSMTLELMNIKGETIAMLNTSDKNRVFDFEKTITTNDVNTISFKMKFTNKYITSNSCEMLLKIVGESETYIIKTVAPNDSDTKIVDIKAVHKLDASKSLYVKAINEIGKTPQELFNSIITATTALDLSNKYIWSGTDITDQRDALQVESAQISFFEAIVKLAEVFSAWWEFSETEDGKIHFFLRKNEIDKGRYITKGSNLKELNINFDSSEIKTRMYLFGKADLITNNPITVINVNPIKEDWICNYDYFYSLGMTLSEIESNPQCVQECQLTDEKYIDDISLYNHGVEELKLIAVPKIDGTVGIIDTSIFEDTSVPQVDIGEKVVIIDMDINFMFSCRITSITRKYTDNPMDIDIEISNLISYTSVFKNLVQTSQITERLTTHDDGGDAYIPDYNVKDPETGFSLHKKVGDLEGSIEFTEEKLQTNFDNLADDTHSQFLQMADRFEMTVTKGEFGSQMIQNWESFMYTFNNISSYVKIDSTGITAGDETVGAGLTKLTSNGIIHLENKDDPLGKPYHYLTDSVQIEIHCIDGEYNMGSVALPSKFSKIKSENITLSIGIKKVWKEGSYNLYWFGGYPEIIGQNIIVSAMSAWRDRDTGEISGGNILVNIVLIA